MPDGWRVKDPKKFLDDLIRGLQAFGDEVHAKSQEPGYCPVDKGTLRSSSPGSEKLPNGFRIRYRTSYAAVQEFGLPPGTEQRVKKHTVKRHTVKRRSVPAKTVLSHAYINKKGKPVIVGSYTVRQHVIATHSRLEHERGPFTREYPEGIPGKFYLSRAYEEKKSKLVKFIIELQEGHA